MVKTCGIGNHIIERARVPVVLQQLMKSKTVSDPLSWRASDHTYSLTHTSYWNRMHVLSSYESTMGSKLKMLSGTKYTKHNRIVTVLCSMDRYKETVLWFWWPWRERSLGKEASLSAGAGAWWNCVKITSGQTTYVGDSHFKLKIRKCCDDAAYIHVHPYFIDHFLLTYPRGLVKLIAYTTQELIY